MSVVDIRDHGVHGFISTPVIQYPVFEERNRGEVRETSRWRFDFQVGEPCDMLLGSGDIMVPCPWPASKSIN